MAAATSAGFEAPVKGVKELADEGLTEIPGHYIKPEHARVDHSHSQQLTAEEEGIPAVDLSKFHGEDRHLLVKEIAEAASKWGFFQVINHGVPTAVMESMSLAALAFFSLPLEEKMALFSEDYKLPLRFCTSFVPSTEAHWDWHDNLTHYFPPYGEDHPWPENPGFYKKAAVEYLEAVTALGDVISAVLSEGLGLESDYFAKAFGPKRLQSIRLNYYPPCPRPELAMGISPHSDFGGFTILLQDEVGGLQVKKDGVWHWLKPIPGAFVVNVSDQLQIFSNGKYQSAEHRVAVNSTKARLSIATFFEPGEDVVVAPVKELISDENPARYRQSLFGTYLGQQFSKYFDSKRAI